MVRFSYTDLLPLGEDTTTYRLLTTDGVERVGLGGIRFLRVADEALRLLSAEAIRDLSHLLRPSHLQQLADILDDPEASANDRFVATELLHNANIAAGFVLPGCQDTGTVVIKGKKGQHVLTDGDDRRALALGAFDTYQRSNLRFSQMAPLSMWEEVNTATNLPAEIRIEAAPGDDYRFLFMTKGGGSANKSQVFQESRALLHPAGLRRFLDEKLRLLGTSACPPYHLGLAIGGTSAEFALETAKLASARYLDSLPTEGSALGHGYRDLAMEAEVLELTRRSGIGAQFGGKYFCHDVRVVRLPRHGGSLPVALAVGCSADRQALARITADGVFLEELERDPARFLPDVAADDLGDEVVNVDLDRPMDAVRSQLSHHPIGTRLSLTGTLVVARDIAHAAIAERLAAGGPLPSYLRDHPVYYAGPAKRPEGHASGSFGPTTAGRMDAYVERFQAAGGSLVMLAKGNRSRQVTDACKRHGGFYLGSIGGPAARLARDSIRSVEVLAFPEFDMEAVWRIEVEDFPAFIVIDDKGNDFYAMTSRPVDVRPPPSHS